MAPDPRALPRFSRTERAVHWVHATAFLILLGSGLCLYLPSLSEVVSRRPLLKAIHIYTAVAWIVALALSSSSATGASSRAPRARSTASTPTTARGCAAAARRRDG